MAKPRINSGEFTGLKEKGVSAQSLETLRNAIALGAKIATRADLIRIGVPTTEADVIAGNSSFSTDPEPKPVTVLFSITPSDLVGYSLGVRRDFAGTSHVDEALLPISPGKPVEYSFDESFSGDSFTLFVKSPGGDLVETTIDGVREPEHTLEKAQLGAHPIDVVPVPEVQNAKRQPAAALPLLAPTRLKGRLICGTTTVSTDSRQIVIEVAIKDDPGDADFFPVGFAETEANGYFITSQLEFAGAEDNRQLTGARAQVAMAPQTTIPIRLEPVEGGKGTLPRRLILLFEVDGEPEDRGASSSECDDCADLNFHDKKVLDEFSYFTVVRTTEPVIETYEIDDIEEIELDDLLDDVDPDLRGRLAGLKVNRYVLSTFIARNRTISRKNVDELLANVQADSIRRKVLALPKVRKGRSFLDSRTEVDWDEKPTVYQAVSIAHGHLLHFKQEWFHDGYSIGDLLYSLPLAPGQKKQIVVFDWDRKESAANVQRLDYQESLYNSLSRDRDVNEVANATLSESIHADSTASSWGVGGGLGIGAIIPTPVPIGALLGVAGGYGKGSSNANQDASRTSTASSQQQIVDRTVQSANAVRSQRSTVIQTVSQGERFEVSAESVANYNHCHAMTIQYFEVLRHFEARTRLADVQECLFIPLKMSPFTPRKALRWRDILQRSLRARSLTTGFDALYRIEEEQESASENYYDSIGLPRDRFAEETIEYIEGELYVEFQIQRPRNDDDDEFVEASWSTWSPFLGSPREFYNRFLRHDARRDEAFAKHAGPRIAQAVLDEIRFHGVKNGPSLVSRKLPIDATLMSSFRSRTRLNVSLRMSGPINGMKREDIDYVRISLDGATLNSDLLRSLTNEGSLRVIVHSGSLRYRTRNLHEYLFQSSSIRNDLTLDGDDVRVFCPLNARELARPRLEDVEVSNALLHHLNENLEYYHQRIWGQMDSQRRFMLLDGIIAPGRSQGRSVASVVENRLIGIVGNSLVVPVAPGFKLDPVLNEDVDLYEHYYEEPLDPTHLSLPTKGVFAEAVMGRCNSCEKKDESRFWRWEESPIPDSPTAISPITAPTPQATQPNLTAKDLATPLINIQNGPDLPDPQGFAALTTLLANPNLFRDLTGLSENQKNALAALQASLSTAEKFGQGAAELTQAAAAMKLIQDARKQGALTNEDADEAAKKIAKTATPKTDEEKLGYLETLLDRLKKWADEGKIPSDVQEDEAGDAVDNTVQETTAPQSEKRQPAAAKKRRGKRTFNLTLLMKDFEERPLTGSWELNFGSLQTEVFDLDGNTFSKTFTVQLDTSKQNIMELKGNPHIVHASGASPDFYYYLGAHTSQLPNNRNMTFEVYSTRTTVTVTDEEGASTESLAEHAVTRELSIASAPQAEVDLLVVKFGGSIEVTGSRAISDSSSSSSGTSTSSAREYTVRLPARRLKIRQTGVNEAEVDVDE